MEKEMHAKKTLVKKISCHITHPSVFAGAPSSSGSDSPAAMMRVSGPAPPPPTRAGCTW